MTKGKGGKKKRKGKKGGFQETRELIFKDEEQEYAQVVKMLGNGRLDAKCADGKSRLCHIRGKMRKRVWINTDDIILLGLRDFDDSKADVIHKYMLDEARTLQAYGELPESWVVGGAAVQDGDEDAGEVAFGAAESESESEELQEENMEDLLDAL
jgi:translation initiation factor 1A